MTLKEAISILASHQKWRLGDENTPMTVPSELTDSIAVILKYHSEKGNETQQNVVTNIGKICYKNHFVKVNEMVISEEEIKKYAEDNGYYSYEIFAFIEGAKLVLKKINNKYV